MEQELKLKIQKHGERMNAIKPERRYLYLYVEPEDWRTAIALTTSIWSLPPAVKRVWWEQHSCAMCRKRHEYELSKWKAGEYAWRRGMCMRHYLVKHLGEIIPTEPDHLLDNRPINIMASQDRIVFETATNSYQYRIDINKEEAISNVTYKGKEHVFKYRNHTNAYPMMSSYAYILSLVIETMHTFRRFLSNVDKYRSYANIVINSTI
jgi:hypothetical protein